MIKKQIDFDGYNIVLIEKMYDNGDVVATIQQIETTDGIETIVKQDTNIVFEAGSFEFTSEELDYFLPKSVVNDLIL